jgi:hypothetical protein
VHRSVPRRQNQGCSNSSKRFGRVECFTMVLLVVQWDKLRQDRNGNYGAEMAKYAWVRKLYALRKLYAEESDIVDKEMVQG